MLNKSSFTLPVESLKKKYGSEALLGHANDDVNLKNTILTGIMQWPRLTLATWFSFEDRPSPYDFRAKNGRSRP